MREIDRSFRQFAIHPKGSPFVSQILTLYRAKLQYRGTAISQGIQEQQVKGG